MSGAIRKAPIYHVLASKYLNEINVCDENNAAITDQPTQSRSKRKMGCCHNFFEIAEG